MIARDAEQDYIVAARRISGSREEMLLQIDDALREVGELKRRICAGGTRDVWFAPYAARSHWFAMTVTILVLFIVLAMAL